MIVSLVMAGHSRSKNGVASPAHLDQVSTMLS
jgi:hypothetical protein